MYFLHETNIHTFNNRRLSAWKTFSDPSISSANPQLPPLPLLVGILARNAVTVATDLSYGRLISSYCICYGGEPVRFQQGREFRLYSRDGTWTAINEQRVHLEAKRAKTDSESTLGGAIVHRDHVIDNEGLNPRAVKDNYGRDRRYRTYDTCHKPGATLHEHMYPFP